MNSKIKRGDLLKIFTLISVVSTLIHNIDNYLFFSLYPQPDWITPNGIIRSWIIWTIFGVAGYLLYKNQRFISAYICLIIYSSCGLSSLAHYFYGGINEFSMTMHLFILTDGIIGMLILGFTIWSSLFLREQFRSSLLQ